MSSFAWGESATPTFLSKIRIGVRVIATAPSVEPRVDPRAHEDNVIENRDRALSLFDCSHGNQTQRLALIICDTNVLDCAGISEELLQLDARSRDIQILQDDPSVVSTGV
jgi:hypothetical protein